MLNPSTKSAAREKQVWVSIEKLLEKLPTLIGGERDLYLRALSKHLTPASISQLIEFQKGWKSKDVSAYIVAQNAEIKTILTLEQSEKGIAYRKKLGKEPLTGFVVLIPIMPDLSGL